MKIVEGPFQVPSLQVFLIPGPDLAILGDPGPKNSRISQVKMNLWSRKVVV